MLLFLFNVNESRLAISTVQSEELYQRVPQYKNIVFIQHRILLRAKAGDIISQSCQIAAGTDRHVELKFPVVGGVIDQPLVQYMALQLPALRKCVPKGGQQMIDTALKALKGVPVEELLERRYAKFRAMGNFSA